MTEPSASPSRWRAWLAAALIFILGFGCGGVCAFVVGARMVRRAIASPPGTFHFAERATERVANDLIRQLNLTPEQAATVRAELTETGTHLRTLRAQNAQEVRREIRATIRRIAQSLPEEKRAEFRTLIRKRIARTGVEIEDPGQPPDPN